MKTQNACYRWEQSTLQDAPPFREEELVHRGTQDTGHWTGYIRTQQPQAASSHFEGHTMYSCEVKSCWRFVGQAQVENTSCNGYKDRFHLCSTLPISCSLAPLPETCSTDLHLRMLNFKWKLLRCHAIPWGTWLGRSMLHSHVLPQPPFRGNFKVSLAKHCTDDSKAGSKWGSSRPTDHEETWAVKKPYSSYSWNRLVNIVF